MARVRIATPSAHIPVTSALGLHGDALRLKGLEVGDVLMPSFTPEDVRAAYAIYPGKNAAATPPPERAAAMKGMLLEHGFTLPAGPGGAWRKEKI
jgi:biotin synthase